MRLGVLLIHGIGDQGPDWADAIIRSLEQRVLEQLRSLLDQPPLDAGSVLSVGRVHWADVLATPQQELRRILDRAHASPTAEGSWWQRLLGTVTGALRRQESRFIAAFIGDVIGYRSPSSREAIYTTIAMPLKPLNSAYDRVVLADAQVRTGPYLLAHMRYLTNEETLAIISRKLALDWCAQNDQLPAPRWLNLSAAYDRTLGLAGVGRPSAR